MCLDLNTFGKSQTEKYFKDNNINIKDFVCRFNFRENKDDSKLINERLKNMRNNKDYEEFIKASYKSYSADDKQKKFPIYHYKKSDIKILISVMKIENRLNEKIRNLDEQIKTKDEIIFNMNNNKTIVDSLKNLFTKK